MNFFLSLCVTRSRDEPESPVLSSYQLPITIPALDSEDGQPVSAVGGSSSSSSDASLHCARAMVCICVTLNRVFTYTRTHTFTCIHTRRISRLLLTTPHNIWALSSQVNILRLDPAHEHLRGTLLYSIFQKSLLIADLATARKYRKQLV